MALQNLVSSFRSLTLQTRSFGLGTLQHLKSFSPKSINNGHDRCVSHFLNKDDLQNSIEAKDIVNNVFWPVSSFSPCLFNINCFYFQQKRSLSTSLPQFSSNFLYMHKRGPIIKKRRNKNPLGDKPFAKGVVLKVFAKKPRKPNSANRKCVLLRLSTGKEMTAYIPGIGHNLQEHNVVLVKVARLRDTPGVKLKCVRGAYDLGHVIKKTN